MPSLSGSLYMEPQQAVEKALHRGKLGLDKEFGKTFGTMSNFLCFWNWFMNTGTFHLISRTLAKVCPFESILQILNVGLFF